MQRSLILTCPPVQVLLPSQAGGAKKYSNVWEQGLWAAKIGATTVGIGALFAVTGAEPTALRCTASSTWHIPCCRNSAAAL